MVEQLGSPARRRDHAVVHLPGHGESRHRILCQKPAGREFHDYYELVTSYVSLFAKHALLLDPECTARTGGGIVREHNAASPFNYVDTAFSRAGVETFSRRLEGMTVAIVGLGGSLDPLRSS